jgi:proteasome lid subunit RPN8/RPN11
MLASDLTITCIKIPLWLWAAVIFDLRRRGGGTRESGAFLLGHDDRNPARVSTYICYDDLDPAAYQKGTVAFHASGCAALWQYCRSRQLQLLIDVHTHPGRDVSQSSIDERHPMLPILGHTAIIVPNFGKTGCWSLNAVGVYEYLGSFRWRTHSASAPRRRVKLSLW